VAERRGQAPRHPLTADLAGVLAAARREGAPTYGRDAAPWGVGAAVLRFAKGLAGGAILRRAHRADGGSSIRGSRMSA
jgi:hypothetical protein